MVEERLSRLFGNNCSLSTLLEKFTWLVTEKARDGKYSHCAGKFTDTMRVKDQIEKLKFEFSMYFVQITIKLDWI
jgi:hypothetical protein